MRTHPTAGRERALLLLGCPALWPCWPFLPVVRRAAGGEELGVVFDARSARLTGYSAAVFKTNLFLLPPDLGSFLALPREVFDSAEELVAAGWRVD